MFWGAQTPIAGHIRAIRPLLLAGRGQLAVKVERGAMGINRQPVRPKAKRLLRTSQDNTAAGRCITLDRRTSRGGGGGASRKRRLCGAGWSSLRTERGDSAALGGHPPPHQTPGGSTRLSTSATRSWLCDPHATVAPTKSRDALIGRKAKPAQRR